MSALANSYRPVEGRMSLVDSKYTASAAHISVGYGSSTLAVSTKSAPGWSTRYAEYPSPASCTTQRSSQLMHNSCTRRLSNRGPRSKSRSSVRRPAALAAATCMCSRTRRITRCPTGFNSSEYNVRIAVRINECVTRTVSALLDDGKAWVPFARCLGSDASGPPLESIDEAALETCWTYAGPSLDADAVRQASKSGVAMQVASTGKSA
mmetsp:Transcript_61349/g.187330  ORF Transcript_61349/g.187330 Transcript_61349/m.187330 type:complete len:208 (+) Transcript_61349:885-1508(+)